MRLKRRLAGRRQQVRLLLSSGGRSARHIVRLTGVTLATLTRSFFQAWRERPTGCVKSEVRAKIGEDVTETLKLVPRQWPPVQHVGAKYSCRGPRSDQPGGRFQHGTFTFRSNVVCRFALERSPTQMLRTVTVQPKTAIYPLLTKQTQEQIDQIFQRVVPHRHFSNFLYYDPPPRPLGSPA